MSDPRQRDQNCANALHHFRLRVLDERLRRGWTQKDLSIASAISASTISKIENGRAIPTAQQFWALQDVLEFSASAMYFDMQGRGAPLQPGLVPVPRDLLVGLIRAVIEKLRADGTVVVALPNWHDADDETLLEMLEALRTAYAASASTLQATA